MSVFNVRCATADSAATLLEFLNMNSTQFSMRHLKNEFEGLEQGTRTAYVTVSTGGTQASGTITLSSMVATDTVTINGVVFTAIASGATGNQFNVGGTDTITATNLAATINASTSAKIVNQVLASSATNVVTVTALVSSSIGNLYTLAISAHGSVSGAVLTGGVDGTTASGNFGVAVS